MPSIAVSLLLDDTTPEATSPEDSWRRYALIGIAFTVPLVVLEHGLFSLPGWAQLLLAAPVQIILGSRFYIGTVRSIRAGRLDMDVLVALGSTTAFVYSLVLYLTSTGGHLFFAGAAEMLWAGLQGADRPAAPVITMGDD